MNSARHVYTLDFSANEDDSLKGRKTALLSCVVFRDFYLAFSAERRDARTTTACSGRELENKILTRPAQKVSPTVPVHGRPRV